VYYKKNTEMEKKWLGEAAISKSEHRLSDVAAATRRGIASRRPEKETRWIFP
jgi:hypothetical protein